MTRTVILMLIFFSGLSPKYSYSQSGNSDINERSAINYVAGIYAESISEQAGLYDGPEYTGYPYRLSEGIPFFLSNDLTTGDVHYNGMLYKNVPMQYDIVKDELLVQYFDKISMISLHSDKVSSFTIFSQPFVRIDTATARVNNIPSGFYNQIYRGKSEVLVKRSKSSLKSIVSGSLSTVILKQKNDLYILKDGKYYRINNEKSAVSVLDNMKEVQQPLKQSKIKFRREPEKALVLMVSAYDKLKN